MKARVARKRRSRAPIVVQAFLVSQLNCMEIIGVDPRRFLELLRDRQIAHAKHGKLRIADVNELREALFDSSVAPNGSDDGADLASVEEDDDPRDVDDVLGVIGRRARR